MSKELQSAEQTMDEKQAFPTASSTSESSGKPEVINDGAQNVTPAANSALAEPLNVDQASTTSALVQASDKKQRPGKLDIAAAKDAATNDAEPADAISEAKRDFSEASGAPVSSQPPTPGTAVSQASVSSAVRQTQPRTITISKGETHPASPSMLMSAITSKQASRRPSISSTNRPGTPLDEKISDNASFTSTSLSRANSPPPSKVGSAPVRKVTKSQQKKERQARARLAEGAAKPEEPAVKVEEVQAPIVGRKKKTKKEKTTDTAGSTPTVTRPTSPSTREEGVEDEPEVSAAPATPSATPVKQSKKGNSKSLPDQEPDTSSSPATPAAGELPKASLTAASIFTQLLKAGEISASASDLFKTFPGINHRVEGLELDLGNFGHSISGDMASVLEHGEPICFEKGPNDHIVMLPDRRILRGFTADQASRYVELWKRALSNGDVPSPQALDGLLLAAAPINTAMELSSNKHAPRSRLINQFATPTSGSTMKASNVQKLGAVNAAGVMDEAIGKNETLLTVAEAEQALSSVRKETEALEKKLNALLKKNKRLLFGNVH